MQYFSTGFRPPTFYFLNILQIICTNHYCNNYIFQLPIIGVDWWEPIYDIDGERILGQVKLTVALGTEDQIIYLKKDRISDFRNSTKIEIGQKCTVINKSTQYNNLSLSCIKVEEQNKSCSDKTSPIKIAHKQDVSTHDKDLGKIAVSAMEEHKNPKVNQELLGTFLNQLMSQRQRLVLSESSASKVETMEEENLQQAKTETNVQLRKTSDLLDCLQKAISSGKDQSLPNPHHRKGNDR